MLTHDAPLMSKQPPGPGIAPWLRWAVATSVALGVPLLAWVAVSGLSAPDAPRPLSLVPLPALRSSRVTGRPAPGPAASAIAARSAGAAVAPAAARPAPEPPLSARAAPALASQPAARSASAAAMEAEARARSQVVSLRVARVIQAAPEPDSPADLPAREPAPSARTVPAPMGPSVAGDIPTGQDQAPAQSTAPRHAAAPDSPRSPVAAGASGATPSPTAALDAVGGPVLGGAGVGHASALAAGSFISASAGAGGDSAGEGLTPSERLDPGFGLMQAVQPRYPPAAASAGQGGEARIEIQVDGNGQVHTVRVVEETGQWGFGGAAREAYLGARFSPPRLHGRPVQVLLRKTIVFSP